MTHDEARRILEIEPAATEEQIRSAWRDLSKVWHPDRFAHDPGMQRKAQDKLKSINAAYETLRGTGAPEPPPRAEGPRAAAASPPDPRRRRLGWGVGLCVLGMFVLLRRPTPGGLLVGLILLGIGITLILRARDS